MVVDGGDVDGSGVAADDDVGRLLELKWKVECPARSLHQDADEFLLTYGEGQRGFARWWCSTPRRGRGKENIHPILDRLTAAGFSLVVEKLPGEGSRVKRDRGAQERHHITKRTSPFSLIQASFVFTFL